MTGNIVNDRITSQANSDFPHATIQPPTSLTAEAVFLEHKATAHIRVLGKRL
jgi:hypothetical protein